MKIVEVDNFADDSSEVTISDGVYQCTAFAWPEIPRVGDHVVEPLVAFDAGAVMVTHQNACSIKRGTGPWDHSIVGRLEDVVTGIVSVGGIYIALDAHLPGDLQAGDLVEFNCARIDVP